MRVTDAYLSLDKSFCLQMSLVNFSISRIYTKKEKISRAGFLFLIVTSSRDIKKKQAGYIAIYVSHLYIDV